ncbi:MAG: ATP-dependent 6-phosphofructokinase [Desulfobacterales bacterium]|nr:ATP-dependent 6-phosphofructokinase [Desulfobacterales bacterium]
MNYNEDLEILFSTETIETRILTLGTPKITSPIEMFDKSETKQQFISDSDRIMLDVHADRILSLIRSGKEPASFELAGPRRKIFFDASKLKCAIVTCGGLCPGLNDIIRSIVLELYHRYGVQHIYGIRYGFQGFIPEFGHNVYELRPDKVVNILDMGGTILGSSRGAQDVDEIVDCLERMNIGILFTVGGDGTLMAASRIADTIFKRGLKISVIGIPKTIDNDIYLVSRSFGFDTAVDVATQAIKSAHNEAEGYPNGIGLIKLMGRYSGFLAATAALAQQDVNFVLIPEVDFDLEGPNGLLAALENRLEKRKHAVIVVAEGAGQKYFETDKVERDPSGNIKLKDIGMFLKNTINSYFQSKNMDVSLKYIDPSYMIRSLPANANDHVFCSFLGRDAVHAGMTGKTKMIIGYWNDCYVHVPMDSSVGKRKYVSPHGKLWHAVLEATGQGPLKNPQ